MDLKKHELTEKIEKNQSFYKQMLKADESYKFLKTHAHYSENLSAVNQNLLIKFMPDKDRTTPIDIFFVFGIFVDESKVSMELITQYFITVFPKPKRQYFLVYFNDYDVDNNFSNFKNMLGLMPIEYFLYLEAIFLVRPSLRMKASRYFTFGTISKYINSKTINIDNLQELSQRICYKRSDIIKFLPPQVKNYFVEQQHKKHHNQLEVPSNMQQINSSGPTVGRTTHQNQNQMTMTMAQKPNSSIITGSNMNSRQSMAVQQGPPVPKKYEITQYDKIERGIPQIFEVLLHYFREHANELEEEGIFRKSVSIEDQNIALQKLHKKQYDFLEQAKDPHLVANLIKRFLSKLKTPLIPYHIFQNLMETQPLQTSYISQKMRELAQQNITKFLTLATLLDFLIRKVVPRSFRNKMPTHNIAICFAPCVMWAEQRSIKDLAYINKSVALFACMMNNFQEIFGSKKELNKVFRTSFYQQQKKSIVQNYNLQPIHHENHVHSVEQQRKTPNFGQLILQKTQKQLQHSDDSGLDQPSQQRSLQPQINILTPNVSSTKSHVQKSELKKDQKQSQLDRKSDRSLNKQAPKIIIQIPPPSVGTYGQVTKSCISGNIAKPSLESPKSGRSGSQLDIQGRVSDNKSDNKEQMRSLHSDR